MIIYDIIWAKCSPNGMKYAVCVRCIADRLTRVGEQLCEQGGDDARVRGVYPARGQDVGQQHLHHAHRHLPLPPLTVQPSVKREPPTAEQTQHTNHGRNEIENQHNLNLLLKYYISINRHRSQHFEKVRSPCWWELRPLEEKWIPL